jgi:hypothetical protein
MSNQQTNSTPFPGYPDATPDAENLAPRSKIVFTLKCGNQIAIESNLSVQQLLNEWAFMKGKFFMLLNGDGAFVEIRRTEIAAVMAQPA